MEPEIELELFAALCADVEAGRPLADVLRAEGLPESTWARSRDAWMNRMSNGPEGERRTLEERYLAAFHARKRSGHLRKELPTGDDDGDEPPTNRAPMGTVIMPAPLPALPPPEPVSKGPSSRELPWGPASVTPPMGVVAPQQTESRVVSNEPKAEVTPPMGVSRPEANDVPWSKAKPQLNPEHTPPMGVRAPNLADIPPPKPLPKPEMTPPMGVAVPNLGENAPHKGKANPEHTPPMGVAVPNLGENASPKGKQNPEHTPPMGVSAPNLGENASPKGKANPEHTPPMGVSAPNLADIPPPKPLPKPEVTPPMGVSVPHLADAAPPSRRRAPEPTPPMRPRSEVVSDDLARSVTDELSTDRKTDPPPPVPSRPALPFPSQMQASASGPMSTSAPSTPFRAPGGGYPAVPPPQAPPQHSVAQSPLFQPVPSAPPVQAPAPSQHFQQSPQQPPAQGSSGPTYGSYPSMVALAAQVAAAGPTSQSSPGFAAPTKPAGAPLLIGAFQATSSGPRMTLEVYAAFAAEIAVKPVDVAEIRERYGLTDVQHTAEDEAWQRRFSSDRDTYVRYAKLFQHYRDWFSARKPR